MNRSEDVRVRIDRLLQLHAIRVRALREEEIAINARTELLQRLTERLLRGDIAPTAAKNAGEINGTVNSSSKNDCMTGDRPSAPIPPTMVSLERGNNMGEAKCEDNSNLVKLLHTNEPAQSCPTAPLFVSESHRNSAVRSADMRDRSPAAEHTTRETNGDKGQGDENGIPGKAGTAVRRTPSPVRRELDAFFPIIDAKHSQRARQSSSTAQAEKKRVKESAADKGTGAPAAQKAMTATDILAGIPCITTTANVQEEETKCYVRTARRRQREYAEEEAMQQTRDGRRITRNEDVSLTPSSYWEIQFPRVPDS